MDLKTCSTCNQEKAASDFPPAKQQCAECKHAWRREWRKRPDVQERQRLHRLRALLAQYGLELAHYQLMLAAQNGTCAICRNGCKTGRNLAVDHDHTTGITRGLLCISCNFLVGHRENDHKRSKELTDAVDAYLAEFGMGHPVLPEGVGLGPLPSRKRAAKVRVKTVNPDSRGRRLTSAKVLEIRTRVAAGESRGAIARELGVNKSSIIRAVNGVSWSNVA